MAGMGTRDIKRKIKSVNNTRQITKAMELVSTAKLKKAKDRLEVTKPYFETVIDAVSEVVQNEKSLKHEFLAKREVKKTLYIVITADRGLCGGYNINAIKRAVQDFPSKEEALLLSIGKRGRDFFRKEDLNIHKDFIYISERPTYAHAQEIGQLALKMYSNEEVDEIKLVYTRLVSTISQEATILTLLPIKVKETTVEDDVDKDFEFMNYEPSPEAVLSFLIPKYVESTIYGGLIDSAASEQAARRVAMESASNNASEMIDSLTLTYNQARQAAITQEISEIVSGAEALK